MNRKVLGEIRIAMELQGITMAELARRMGRTKATVYQYFEPNGNLTLLTLCKICEAIGANVTVTITPAA